MHDNIEPMFAEHQRQMDGMINIRRILSRIGAYWMSIVICVVLSFLCAYVYLRYATPKYVAHAKVLIKSDQQDASNGALLSGLGIRSTGSNIDNEIEVFRSRPLMKRVVENMHLNISYYVPGKIQTTNLYNDAPFRIIPLHPDSAIAASYSYRITAKDAKTYQITSGKNVWNAQVGDTLSLTAGRICFAHNPLAGHMYDDAKQFIVNISPSDAAVDKYLGGLTVDFLNRQSNILLLSMKDVNPQRAEDVLDHLVDEYQRTNIEDKGRIAEGTVQFINERLESVGSELTNVEKDIEQFKVSNSLTNVATQSKELLDKTTDNSRELMQKEVQLKVLESLERYVDNSSNMRRVMPATLIAQDATLVKIIEDYNSLQAERQRMLLAYTENSSYIKNIDVQIDDLRAGMKNYISSLRKGYQVSVDELKAQGNIIESKIRTVPAKERQYLDYERQQQIKQELYLFLLKKREETALSKSATVASLKVVDPARRENAPIAPRRSRIFLMALAIGLVIPGVRIAAKELFNTRVNYREDIEQATSLPVFAEISHNNSTDTVVVKNDSRTVIAEQFRSLRTNLQFLLQGGNEKIIMLTSSMSGEGKSFISVNLASTIALSGKSVVLIELDLRKPKIARHLNIGNERGFSNFMVGTATLDEIILPSGILPNFSVITSGPVPPNPSELIMLPKVQQLFADLKNRFDFIILDTPPVGLVTDAQLLSRYSDAIVYVVRQGYTHRQQLKQANDLHTRSKNPNMGLVINDMKAAKGADYAYNSNGSGYFEEGSSKIAARFQKILKRNKYSN